MLSSGVKLGNRYRLDERIASGGMGDVWRGTDEVLGRTVAVKSLLPALLDDPDFAERFRGEARTMATINHPGVVDIYDFGSDQQIAFLVMEYVEGANLRDLLAQGAYDLLRDVGRLVGVMHKAGLIHGDLAPTNIIRAGDSLYFIDFGLGEVRKGWSKRTAVFMARDINVLFRTLDLYGDRAEEMKRLFWDGYGEEMGERAAAVERELTKIRAAGRYAERVSSSSRR